MAKDNENKNIVTEDENKEAKEAETKKGEDSKKEEEAKKEWALIRWAKAIGHGVNSAFGAVNGFVKKHPYVTAGMSAAAGYGAKMLVDHFVGNDSDDSDDVPEVDVPMLPEPDDEYVLDMPEEDMEATEENNNANAE